MVGKATRILGKQSGAREKAALGGEAGKNPGLHPEQRHPYPALHFSSVIEGDSWKGAVGII